MALPRQRSAPDPQVGKNLKTFNSFRVRLISHRLPLDHIDKTFEIARERRENVVKAVITFD